MTVIVGINLSNKVYLAGDSRLSYEKNGEIFVRHDNMQKVENLPGARSISIACGGDARFAKYIVDKLRKADFTNGNIADMRNALPAWIPPIADQYFTRYGYSNVILIIGGSDPNKKKTISGKRFRQMADAFTGGKGPIFVNIALQSVLSPGVPVPDRDIELESPDTQLFSVKISRSGVTFTDTNWGELLIYGPEGLVRDEIEDKDIAKFEFDPSFRDNGSGMGNDMASLNAFIYVQAEKHNLSTVGGSVVVFSNNSDGTTNIVTGKTYMFDLERLGKATESQQIQPTILNTILIQGGNIYREVNGTRYKLIPVSKYSPPSKSKMLL